MSAKGVAEAFGFFALFLLGKKCPDVFTVRIFQGLIMTQFAKLFILLPLHFFPRVRESTSIKTSNILVKKAIRFIRNNPKTKLTVGTIAKELGICQTYLSSQFSAETGMNSPAFIKRHRMLYAKYYLQFTKLSLAEIADALCFSSQSAFQNVFKEIVGTTPAAYRAAQTI